MRVGVARAALLAALVVGCGARAPGNDAVVRASAEPIAGGTLDFEHAAVFQEYTHWGNSVSSCTASLIAPNVLLTARHCVAQGSTETVMCGKSVFGDAVAGSATIVTGDTEPGSKSTFYRGVDVRVPAESNEMCGFDIALIILDNPIPAAKVAPLVPRIDQPVELGESYDAVGYGVDDQGQQNPGRMELRNLDVRCLSDECQQFGVAPTEFMGTAGICSGDSGGPALDSAGRVIGLVSRGSDPCATPIYTQVAPWRDFITETVLEAAASAGYQPPFWAFSGSSELPPGLASAGEHCEGSDGCMPGSVCYFEGDPSTATCTRVCANGAQCSDGEECRSGYDVQGGGLCLAVPASSDGAAGAPSSTPPSHGADEHCSMSAAPVAHGGVRLFVLGVALAGLGLRRRRPRARC